MRRVAQPDPAQPLRFSCLAVALALALVSMFACIVALGGCDASAAEASQAAKAVERPAPLVRVLVISRAAEAKISATLPPTLSGEALGGAVRLSLPKERVSVTLAADGWHIGDQTFPRGPLTLAPAAEGSLTIDNRRFRGNLRLVPRKAERDRFDVVNDLDLESYLLGVLPSELPVWFDPTTYKAQAVVARTYAIWELKTAGKGRGHFDLYDDDRSQVYGGLDAESEKGWQGVEATRGQVVVHATPAGPRIFKAYFHSTSGGATLGVESAFNEPPSKALSAQSLDGLSAASPRDRWDPIVLTKDELTRRVKAWGERRGHAIKRIGKVDRLEIVAVNEFGRPTRFEIMDTKGNRYSLIPEEVRWALNTGVGTADKVYSGFFTPINNDSNIVISDGRGWGHGVGMCQFSADAWAKQGRDHVEIVTSSYPETSVVRAY